MRLNRIYAINLRFVYLLRHSLDRTADIFYWPTIDLILWGLASSYFSTFAQNMPNLVVMIISGLLFWMIVWRSQIEISISLLEDVWEKNLVNIFGSPLKFSEWVLSLILLGLGKAAVSFSFALVIAFLLYKVKIFFYGFYLLPFMISLIMTGWWIGFIIAGFIMRYGTKIQTFAWGLIYVISPFSAIFYPLSILPSWAQKIALFVPASYIFEGMRNVINTGSLDYNKLYISFLINFIYLILAILFLKSSYKNLLNRGVIKLN